MRIFTILIAGVFVNNFLLSKFLGICSFLGVSKKVDTSIGMGIAVIFVMTLASAITYVYKKIKYVSISGIGDLSATDHNKLCCFGCLHFEYSK